MLVTYNYEDIDGVDEKVFVEFCQAQMEIKDDLEI